MKKVFITLFSAALLLSCGGEKKNSAAEGVEEKNSGECVSPTNEDIPSSPLVDEKDVEEDMVVVAEEVDSLVIEKEILPPPPGAKKPTDVIRIVEVEDDVEFEEEELVPVQDTSEWGDVEETEAIYVEEERIFDVVEENPEFPGGTAALMKYISNNVKYPRISRDNGSQGKAFVRFVVNADGSIQDAEIIKSTGDMYLDKEAIRVIEAMPKWTPGREKGKPVRVEFVLPLSFRLQ